MLAARDGKRAGDIAQSIIEAGGLASATTCDVSDYAAVEALVRETESRFGPVDALINNAGVIERSRPSPTAIHRMGAQYRNQPDRRLQSDPSVAASDDQGRRRTIVNVSSGAAIRPLDGWSAYCTGKAGLAMLTRAIMLENTANGIRVFGFQPGTTDTDMQVTIRASGINMVSQIPRQNLTPVAHPAAAIVYLCTPAADDLNGQEFSLRDEPFRAR